MRRFAQMVVAALVALSVAACAATTEQKHSYRTIKCPACAYEFEMPAKN
jgi:hypothetical protein